jgi:SAM-dependent methyltransferase
MAAYCSDENSTIEMSGQYVFKLKRLVYLCREAIRTERSRWARMKNFEAEWSAYNKMANNSQQASMDKWYPCLFDNTGDTKIEPIYFYQDSWAFEKIYANKPRKHFDIGSHHKFVALLSKVVDLTMIDIRPLSLPLDSIRFVKGTILNLPFEDSSIESLSSMCVVEHIGLGRYGDPLDPNGSALAFKEIERVISRGGHFYFSVPVEGETTTYFNAHRSFNENELLNDILKGFKLISKKYITAGGEFTEHYDNKSMHIGCYHLQKN